MRAVGGLRDLSALRWSSSWTPSRLLSGNYPVGNGGGLGCWEGVDVPQRWEEQERLARAGWQASAHLY